VNHAEEVLKTAQKELKVQQNEFEKLKTDSTAPAEDRLFVYDMELAQLAPDIKAADGQVMACEDELAGAKTIAETRSAQAKLDKAIVKRDSLKTKELPSIMNEDKSEHQNKEKQITLPQW